MSELRFILTLCRDGAADGLSYPFFRHLHPTAMEIFSFFNWIYTSELFPDLWHQSVVIPIPKPGKDRSLPGNFSPISLTSCLYKLFERLVALGLGPGRHPEFIPPPFRVLSIPFHDWSTSLLRVWYLGCIWERQVGSCRFLWFAESVWYHVETWGFA